MNKAMPVLAMALLLAACGDAEQEKLYAAKQCLDESMKRPINEFDTHIIKCMKAKGYVFDANGVNCSLAEIKEESENCYRKAD